MYAAGDCVGEYVIDAHLGGGGSADVFRAHRHGSTESVALKVLHTDATTHARARERFHREFAIAAMLHHRHIVAVYDEGEVATSGINRTAALRSVTEQPASTMLWMTMQYVDGPPSNVLIPRAGQAPDIAAVCRIAGQIAEALDYAHSMDVIHRDVKPANILLTADQTNGLLTDFGIAQLVDSAAPLARNGRVQGSIEYASPELLQGQQLSPAADLYALACTLFEWLTGTAPFDRDTAFAITYAHLRDPVPKLTARQPWLPAALNAVFAKALAKTAAQRYTSCREFVHIVTRNLRDVGAPSPPAPRRWWRRSPG